MSHSLDHEELVRKMLVHMYNDSVIGTVNVTSALVGSNTTFGRNPRLKDVQKVCDLLGSSNQRLFFDFIAAIAESVAYCMLLFIEDYNNFDSERNSDEYPRLALRYLDSYNGKITDAEVTRFGSSELGTQFKVIARSPEMRGLVDAAVENIVTALNRLRSGQDS